MTRSNCLKNQRKATLQNESTAYLQILFAITSRYTMFSSHPILNDSEQTNFRPLLECIQAVENTITEGSFKQEGSAFMREGQGKKTHPYFCCCAGNC